VWLLLPGPSILLGIGEHCRREPGGREGARDQDASNK
jgi:hypothetical protein